MPKPYNLVRTEFAPFHQGNGTRYRAWRGYAVVVSGHIIGYLAPVKYSRTTKWFYALEKPTREESGQHTGLSKPYKTRLGALLDLLEVAQLPSERA